MKKVKLSQIVASVALFAIVLSVIGTGILIITGGSNQQTVELTQEEIQQFIDAQSGAITSSGDIIDTPKQLEMEVIETPETPSN